MCTIYANLYFEDGSVESLPVTLSDHSDNMINEFETTLLKNCGSWEKCVELSDIWFDKYGKTFKKEIVSPFADFLKGEGVEQYLGDFTIIPYTPNNGQDTIIWEY